MPDPTKDWATATAAALDASPDTSPTVADAPGRQRFEAHLGNDLAGVLEYEIRRDRIILVHTEVAPPYEGRGLGAALVRFALHDARERDLRVTAACPYVEAYLARHPELRAGVTGSAEPPA